MRTDDGNVLLRFVILCVQVLDLSNYAFAIEHFAKDDMLAVKMGSRAGGYKELRAVRV